MLKQYVTSGLADLTLKTKGASQEAFTVLSAYTIVFKSDIGSGIPEII